MSMKECGPRVAWGTVRRGGGRKCLLTRAVSQWVTMVSTVEGMQGDNQKESGPRGEFERQGHPSAAVLFRGCG